MSLIDRNQARIGPFTQTTLISSTIAAATELSNSEVASAVTIFWRLYWGEFPRFPNVEVEGAMVLGWAIYNDFHSCDGEDAVDEPRSNLF